MAGSIACRRHESGGRREVLDAAAGDLTDPGTTGPIGAERRPPRQPSEADDRHRHEPILVITTRRLTPLFGLLGSAKSDSPTPLVSRRAGSMWNWLIRYSFTARARACESLRLAASEPTASVWPTRLNWYADS